MTTASNDTEMEFWERPELVDRFVNRDPDKRLLDLLPSYERPAATRILDLGCAGGRNTEVLAAKGFDVAAIDASHAMVHATRRRVGAVLGADEAARRVTVAPMDDLRTFETGTFELVIALGIYHNASSLTEWDAAVSESARVLAQNGLVLYAGFGSQTDPDGEGVRPVTGSPHVFDGFRSGRVVLLDADDVDTAMARHGLDPVVATTTVEVSKESGRRVTVNGLYRKIRTTGVEP